MNAAVRIEVLLCLLCALLLSSCADETPTGSNSNLKLESIPRPMGQPPTYLYRKEPAADQ